MSFRQPPLPFNSGQSAPRQQDLTFESHDRYPPTSSTSNAPVTSHSTFVVDFKLMTTTPHEIPGIPLNPESHLNDHVTGPFVKFLKDKMPFWMMSRPIPPFDLDYLDNSLESYSRETGDSRITIDAYKCQHILHMMNDMALRIGDSDEADIASFICGELKLSSKGKKKRDDILPSPLYDLRRVDMNSPRSLWMENKALVAELLRLNSPEFIHGKTFLTLLLHPDFVKILFFVLERYNRIAVLIRSGQKRLLNYIFSYVAFKIYLVLDAFKPFGIYARKDNRSTEDMQRILFAFQQYFVDMETRSEFIEIAESLYTTITADENEIKDYCRYAKPSIIEGLTFGIAF